MSANQPPENDVPSPGGDNPPAGSNPPPAAPQFAPAGQPQQPPAAGYPPAGGAFIPQPPPASKKGGMARRLLFAIGGAIVAIVIGILVRSGVFDSPAMKVGDCVQQISEDSVKVVACDSQDAQFSVLGIVEKQGQVTAQLACQAYAETTNIYWEGRNKNTGTVYCLKKL